MRFEAGAAGPLHVRRERVRLGLPRRVRLLYASDLHLGRRWTAHLPGRLLDAARAARPDLILLGGDLVDTARALPELGRLVTALGGVGPVCAVPGNHDEGVGTPVVREAVRSAGGRWLPDDPLTDPVRIDGVVTPSADRSRILCGHDPAVFPAAVAAGYGLVLAGHLHGGQCVLWERGGRQFPAAWFNRWHGERFTAAGGQAVMLVSRGAADTLPFRLNCPREVLLCAVT